MKHEYGFSYKEYPIEQGTALFSDGSRLKTHDIMSELPSWMSEADLIFTDGPWNTGNLKSFYTKAEIEPEYNLKFEAFYHRFFECVAEISPETCYAEIGKEYLADYITEMRKIFKHVTFFNSSYYHKPSNFCYIVRGAKTSHKGLHLDDIDEEDIIDWIGKNEKYSVIGDLCIGRGLVALAAYKNKKRFVGTELNHKRLSVALKRLINEGASYEISM